MNAKVKLVTGYVPIKNHPRTAEEYGKLGDELGKVLAAPLKAYYNQIHECWLKRFLWESNFEGTHSEGDNPAKNTLDYLIVQHQKFEWLLKATTDPDPETFVWLDYGVCRLPNVDAYVIDSFVEDIQRDDFALPGCWAPRAWGDRSPNWRFCGSLFVVPRQFVGPLYEAIREEVRKHIKKTNNVTWEVNTLAAIEKKFPIRWYQADHDSSMFTGYKEGA